MAIQEKQYTVDDLWEMVKQRDDDVLLELIDGVIYEVPPSSAIPSTLAMQVGFLIKTYVASNRIESWVSGADGGYELSPKNVLAPDVGVISKQRHPELPTRWFLGAPDLAVEVVSPSDSVKAVQRKAAKYLAYGSKTVWIVYPDDKTVDVCRAAEGGGMIVQEIGMDGELDGGEVLPGFKVPLSEIFAL